MKNAFSFNPMDPQLLADPYPIFRQMRENDPVHRSDLGFLVMTRYEDCRHVLIDKTFGQGDFVRNIQLFYDADLTCYLTPLMPGYPGCLSCRIRRSTPVYAV